MSARGDDIDEGRSLPYQFEAERKARIARRRAAADRLRDEIERRKAAASEPAESLLDAAERIHGGDK